MKRRNSILMAVVIFISLILTSCSGSVKGKWTEDDKQKFLKEMEGIEELSALGEQKAKWIDCYLSKCESTYSSFEEADSDEKGLEKIQDACLSEVFANGSVKGKWSESDKKRFFEDIDGSEEVSSLGEDKEIWVDCYLNKVQTTFASYYEANMNEEQCEKLVLECNVEAFK